MHASLENLLNLRDGDADETTRQHVAACPQCRSELVRLGANRERLQRMPYADPPEDRWHAVRRGLESRRRAAKRAPLFAGLAAAASVLLVLAFVVRVEPPVTASTPDPLVQRSQELERELRAMGQRGVLSGAEAQVIDELQNRIAVVDLQLASGELDAAEAERLWRRRVDLLMELKAVRSDDLYLANASSYVL